MPKLYSHSKHPQSLFQLTKSVS